MAGNTFGQIFRITTYGESHGKAIGVTIDGCPAGLEIDLEFILFKSDTTPLVRQWRHRMLAFFPEFSIESIKFKLKAKK